MRKRGAPDESDDEPNAARAALLALTAPGGAPVRADQYRLESATLPAPFLEDGKPNVVIEASAVEPIGDGRLWLIAHDKHPALHVVDAATGRLMGAPITTPKCPAPNATGPKWEGMALDSEGSYYLIGAHNGTTDEERATKSVLLRFRLTNGGRDLPTIDDASVIPYLARIRPRARRLPRDHGGRGRGQRLPRQHPLVCRQRPDQLGAEDRDF
jgi:hypothetical protein